MSSYASPADLIQHGIAAAALDGISTPEQQQALDSASGVADGYLKSQFTLPLVPPYSQDLVRAVCMIAAYDLLFTRGLNPTAGDNSYIEGRYQSAIGWLKDVARQLVHPELSDSTAPDGIAATPIVRSKRNRGWDQSC